MYSTFRISKSECMTCNNQVLKSLGSLRGVFGAEIETIDGKITINHTDEINRKELSEHLKSLGWFPIENDDDGTPAYEPPSEWGCVL